MTWIRPNLVIVLAILLIAGTGCGRQPANIKVSPVALNLKAIGSVETLYVEVIDARSRPIGDAAVEWTSSDPSVAKVDETGTVTAVSSGDALIVARLRNLSASCSVLVSIPTYLEVTPAMLTLEVGSTARLSATVKNEKGDEIEGIAVNWMSSDPTVAEVSANGEVSAGSEGKATITVEGAELEASVPVEVIQASDKNAHTEETPD